jgi:hypothetical protein
MKNQGTHDTTATLKALSLRSMTDHTMRGQPMLRILGRDYWFFPHQDGSPGYETIRVPTVTVVPVNRIQMVRSPL